MVDRIAGGVGFGSDQAAFFSVSCEQVWTREKKLPAMERIILHTARQREALHPTLRGVTRHEGSRLIGCSESNYVRQQEAAHRELAPPSNLRRFARRWR